MRCSDSWREDAQQILSQGLPLHQWGINNWALSKQQAMSAIDELEGIGIPILGGDVFRIANSVPAATYDN